MQENFMHINLQVLPLAYILFAFYLLRQNLAEGLHEDKKEDIYPKK